MPPDLERKYILNGLRYLGKAWWTRLKSETFWACGLKTNRTLKNMGRNVTGYYFKKKRMICTNFVGTIKRAIWEIPDYKENKCYLQQN